MARFEFKDLEFVDDNTRIKVVFYRIYFFFLQKNDFEEIGQYSLESHAVVFDAPEKKSQNKLYKLLQKGFEELRCSITGAGTVYVHKNSGIPIIGEGIFGLIDRNTSCIEVKPLTCCNLDCVYCSVDAGHSSRKKTGYIVEEAYLVEEFNKLAEKKNHDVEAHIGPQGEPLLYAPLLDLIRDLRKNPKVKVVSIDTNGTMLTKRLVDGLADAGLTRLNISLQSIDDKKATEMAGAPYNAGRVIEMMRYASKKLNVLIAPVIVPGYNDDQIEGIILEGKKISSSYPALGIQNFLNYKRGRNPAKQRSWEEFYSTLDSYEKKHSVNLVLSREDFGILPDAKLEKPFGKKQIIKALIVAKGPEEDEKIASYKGRAIIVEKAGKAQINTIVKVLVVRDKHNVYRGVLT